MTGEKTQEQHPSSGNRYLLVAILAFVALVTVLLLKQNMEPPAEQAGGGQPTQTGRPDQEQARQMAMEQIAHVADILARDSSDFDAWSALGNLYFDINMPAEAIEHYEGALRLRPNDTHVLTDLATMKREAGQAKDAVEILQKVVSLDSTLEQAWFNLGVIYSFDLDDQRAAMDAWKRFLALNPDSPHTDAVRQEIERIEREL